MSAEDLGRRQDARQNLVLSVHYDNSDAYIAGWTENVSAGCLFVRTHDTFELGDWVSLRLSFPGLLHPMDVKRQVGWVRPESDSAPPGIGVQGTHDTQRRRLAQLALRSTHGKQPRSTKTTFRVLVAEDNAFMQKACGHVLKHMTKEAGALIDMKFVSDGHEALLQVKKNLPDLVITDLNMPVLDGREFLRVMRSQSKTREVPVIVLTGDVMLSQDELRRLRISSLLIKPVQFGELLETIVYLMRLRLLEDSQLAD